MSSKFAQNRPKFTPPAVCHKSDRGKPYPNLRPPAVYAPPAIQGLASVFMRTPSTPTGEQVNWTIHLAQQSPDPDYGGQTIRSGLWLATAEVAFNPSTNQWASTIAFEDYLGAISKWSAFIPWPNWAKHPPIRYDGSWPQLQAEGAMVLNYFAADQTSA